jgi:O-methyltransferase involved in polyketide biosynthesis
MAPEKIKIELGEIQKTLLIPLWGRAKEMEKPKPLVRDTYARDLVSRLDFDFGTLFGRMPGQFLINCAVRAHAFDQALHRFIAANPTGTIINIGAGLDTTFQRVDNGRITWYDLDLPDSMALRRQLIPEGARNFTIARSVFDRTWFEDVKVKGSKVFMMAGGVFAYLPEKEIRALFLDLIGAFPESEIMFEIYAKLMVWIRNVFLRKNSGTGDRIAPFRWGVNSAQAIAKWSPAIKVLEQQPFYAQLDLTGIEDQKLRSQIKAVHDWNWMKIVRLQLG